MINELIFVFNIILSLGLLFLSLQWGKSGLISYSIIQWFFANTFLLKQINLLGFIVPPSDVFTVGGTLGINILHELYGERVAKKTVSLTFLMMIFYSIFSFTYLSYVPSIYDYAHYHFEVLFSPLPRVIIGSLTAYFISQHFNIFFLSFLEKKISHNSIKNMVSLICTHVLDTFIFIVISFYGIMHSLKDIFIFSCITKVITIAISLIIIKIFKKTNLFLKS